MPSSEIRLRELEDSDLPALLRLLSDMRVVRYMVFPVFTEEAARDFLREVRANTAGTPPRWVVRAIAFADTGIMIGLGGLSIHADISQGEAWYLLDPDYWGKGYATESARQLLDIGFGPLHLHRVWATCLPQNPASARVLKRLGMRREGYLRKNLRVHGEWHDCFLYAILREEWRGGKGR